MRPLDITTESGRPVFLAAVDSFIALGNLKLPSEFSVVLLVADASETESRTIYESAERLIEAGAVYVCTWGADCERVHDILDEADVGDGSIDRDFTVMTTWHSNDSLPEAVDFFLGSAIPSDGHLDAASYVAIAVGDQHLASLEPSLLNSELSVKATNAEQGGAEQPPARWDLKSEVG